MTKSFRGKPGSIGSKSLMSPEEVAFVKSTLEKESKKEDPKEKFKLIARVLDQDEYLQTHEKEFSVYARNYIEGPVTFFP